MTLEEYKAYAKEVEDWAPGWDTIEACFEKVYPASINGKPSHFATELTKRAMFGGKEYLDGYNIYRRPKKATIVRDKDFPGFLSFSSFLDLSNYCHIVTFGLSELYANPNAFLKDYSKWGYELTIKLPDCPDKDCFWAIDMMANLARYTFTTKRYFKPYQYIASNRSGSIKVGSDSKITALLTVPDTEIPGVETLHGRLDFIQLVGITQKELKVLMENKIRPQELIEELKKGNPNLVIDLMRK